MTSHYELRHVQRKPALWECGVCYCVVAEKSIEEHLKHHHLDGYRQIRPPISFTRDGTTVRYEVHETTDGKLIVQQTW